MRSLIASKHFKILLSLFVIFAASEIEWWLIPIMGSAPFILYYPAIIIASIYGDGATAVIAAAVGSQFLFHAGPRPFPLLWPMDYIRHAIFVSSALMIARLTKTRTDALQKAEEGLRALEESEERMRQVLENALDAVIAIDEDGLIQAWNIQAERTFGIVRSSAMGRRLSDLILPPEYRVAHDRGLKHYSKTGVGPILNHRIEIEAMGVSGNRFPIELSVTPTKTGGRTMFYGFLRDISEQVRLLSELKEAIRARDEFVSVASHELKTPITSLKLQFQMTEKQIEARDPRVLNQEVIHKRVVSFNRQIDRMTRLIEDMLDVSRVAVGKMEYDFRIQNLSKITEEVCDRFSEQFKMAGMTLSMTIAPEIFCLCDSYRVEQVISNLLTNALKYGAKRPVHLTLRAHRDQARIEIADQGDGIAKENLERIFNRFERAVSSSDISGLGLGLYICKQIVEAHRGKIWVESDHGAGSCFIVELPLSAH